MPRKPLDHRILVLATQATTRTIAEPSLELRPDAVPNEAIDPAAPGYPWHWCDVTVRVTYAGQTEEVVLKGRSYPDEDTFARTDYSAALNRALNGLLAKLDAAAEALARLGHARKEPA